jgi:hypothetical protein
MPHRNGARLAQALVVFALASSAASAETVVKKQRIGNNTEGMTYAASGPWANHALAIDGNDVLAISLAGMVTQGDPAGSGKAMRGPGWRQIFSVAGGTGLYTPRGIVYLPDQQQFWFSSVDPADAAKFYRTDALGAPLAPIAISGLGDTSDFSNWEGLAWIPATSAHYPGTVAGLSVRRPNFVSQLNFVGLDGTIVATIDPQPGTPIEAYLCGVQYDPARARLLVSTCDANVHAMAFDGTFLGTVISQPDLVDIESIVVDKLGRTWVGSYGTGRLTSFDASYAPIAGNDRFFTLGLGVSVGGMAYNWDTGELLFQNRVATTVHAVPQTLKTARLAGSFDVERTPAWTGLGYLGAGMVAIGDRYLPTRGIEVLNLSSGEVARIVISPDVMPPGPNFQVISVGTLGLNGLAFRSPTDEAGPVMHVVTRGGTPDDSIVLGGTIPQRLPDFSLSAAPTGVSWQAYDDGTGTHYFTGAEIYDATGSLVRTIDLAALGTANGIHTGAHLTGATFAGVEDDTSTVVLYTVP